MFRLSYVRTTYGMLELAAAARLADPRRNARGSGVIWAAAREDAAATSRVRAELEALVGREGSSLELLAAWRSRFPPSGTRTTRNRP